jgi:hypothetical protein
MKCISLWQPWATALFLRTRTGTLSAPTAWLKPDETRCWPTALRGPIAIHAAAKVTRPDVDYDPKLDEILAQFTGRRTADLPRGALLGWMELNQCRPAVEVARHRSTAQQLWGDYRERGDDGKRRYAWVFGDTRILLPCPIPWKGMQGLFEVPSSLFPQPEPTDFVLKP